MSAARPDVLVVGAGPTGLVLAIWLTRLGARVRIVEKAPTPPVTSRALGVQARTLELYRQIGLADTVVEHGVKVEGFNLWVRGRRAARLPFGGIGDGISPFPFLLICPQNVHEPLLVDHLRALGVEVERGVELVRFAQDGEKVSAVLARDGREETVEASFVAGCDGARSTVRQGLGIGFPGGTYSQYFYVADVAAKGPAIDGELHVALDDADFLAVFPLKGAGHARLVGVARAQGSGAQGDVAFEDVSHLVMDQLRIAVGSVNWYSTYHVHHRVADRFRDGRVFLLGDAGHIHSPAGAQGMNTGIADAVNLAWKLAAVARGEATPALLDSYEPERIAFARRLVATTDQVFTFVSRRGRVAGFLRTRIAPRVAPLLVRARVFRRLIFRTGSQVALNYRASALSAGRAGRVQGGDRLPWVRLPEGDNFAPLASIAWQVHVYGAAPAALAAACGELGIALHTFPWRAEMGRAGLARDALYLVRPDGYVALADPRADAGALRAHVARWRAPVQPPSPSTTSSMPGHPSRL